MGGTRVLQVVPYFEAAWGYGGIPRVAAALSAALARRGLRVSVCTTDACDRDARLARGGPAQGSPLRPWPAQRAADGIEVRVFPNLSNRAAYRLQLFLPLGLRGHLRRCAGDYDVAHLHGCHHLPGAIAAAELRRAGVPYLVSPNGTAPRHERRRLAKAVFDHTLGRGVLAGASAVLAVSEAERAQLEALGVARERIRLLPNPLSIAEFDAIPERRAPAPGARRRVLYLGQLTPRKLVDVLVRALAALPEDVELEIAGSDGGCEAGLRALVQRLGLGPRVRFAGLLRGRERLAALAAADAVAYAGRDEVFGLVALEALLCGTPVVVADDSGCGEVVRRTGGGLLVPPGDAPALAHALAQVLADPEAWRARARPAAAEIRRLFASDAVADTCARLYDETIRRESPVEEPRWRTSRLPA
jgi:glycosyltransferase involved in cell wall biosynthesis